MWPRIRLVYTHAASAVAELLARLVSDGDWEIRARKSRLISKFKLYFPHNQADAKDVVERFLRLEQDHKLARSQ